MSADKRWKLTYQLGWAIYATALVVCTAFLVAFWSKRGWQGDERNFWVTGAIIAPAAPALFLALLSNTVASWKSESGTSARHAWQIAWLVSIPLAAIAAAAIAHYDYYGLRITHPHGDILYVLPGWGALVTALLAGIIGYAVWMREEWRNHAPERNGWQFALMVYLLLVVVAGMAVAYTALRLHWWGHTLDRLALAAVFVPIVPALAVGAWAKYLFGDITELNARQAHR